MNEFWEFFGDFWKNGRDTLVTCFIIIDKKNENSYRGFEGFFSMFGNVFFEKVVSLGKNFMIFMMF